MARLPNEAFRQMVPLLRDPDFYEPEKQRPISWPEYTSSQIDEAKDVLEFIRDAVNRSEYLVRKGKRGKPLTDPKELAKSILICENFGFPERIAQGWMQVFGHFVGIRSELDDRVIGEAYDKIEVIHILRQVFDRAKTSDRILCGDGTGLEKSRKENYESAKKRYATYLVSVVDSREIVQDFKLGSSNERKVMSDLIEHVDGESIRLDAGFNDRELVRRIADLEMIPYVFPKCNNKLNGSDAWKAMYLELFFDVMQWLTEYHQRSHAESFHSSFKRKNGVLRKLRELTRLTQVLARIILHNRRRISYFSKIRIQN